MKLLLILFIFYFSLNANEMKRIEAIVGDIAELREEYEGCQTESKIYEMQLKEQIDENKILHQKLNSLNSLQKKEVDYENKIKNLKNKIKEQSILLKSKEKSEKNLINKNNDNTKIKEKSIKNLVLVKCEEANPFPDLLMKEEFLKEKDAIASEEIEKFQASTFRLNKNAAIYNDVNGQVLEEWSKGTSFTSSIKTQNWIKITGHFTDKIWMKSSKDIWVKLSDVIKR